MNAISADSQFRAYIASSQCTPLLGPTYTCSDDQSDRHTCCRIYNAWTFLPLEYHKSSIAWWALVGQQHSLAQFPQFHSAPAGPWGPPSWPCRRKMPRKRQRSKRRVCRESRLPGATGARRKLKTPAPKSEERPTSRVVRRCTVEPGH